MNTHKQKGGVVIFLDEPGAMWVASIALIDLFEGEVNNQTSTAPSKVVRTERKAIVLKVETTKSRTLVFVFQLDKEICSVVEQEPIEIDTEGGRKRKFSRGVICRFHYTREGAVTRLEED